MDQTVSDEELMRRYANGEAKAFEALYQRHKGPLYRYLARLVRPPTVAEELFQDIWTNVIRARERYETRAKFTTWLYRLAHNRLIDYYRRTRSAAVLSYDETEDGSMLAALPADSLHEPDNEVERRRLAQRLVEALAMLPEAQREVFLLREESGLSLDDIASVTGVTMEAAKSRLRYAIAKLRAALADVESSSRMSSLK